MSVKDRRPDHNTGNYVPYSCEQCVGSLKSHKVIMNKGLRDWTYDLSSLSEKTRKFNHLQMSLQRQHFSPQLIFKTLSIGPARYVHFLTRCPDRALFFFCLRDLGGFPLLSKVFPLSSAKEAMTPYHGGIMSRFQNDSNLASTILDLLMSLKPGK